MDEYALQLQNISKYFGSVAANKNIDLTLRKGEILALLGENGSGKTTLMNMISGIYYPDEGRIFVNGEEARISSPQDAFRYKIGMVHQHFKLIDIFTAAQNIVLGTKGSGLARINEEVKAIAEKYGFEIDPKKKIYDMSVSEKQTVEIVKVLYRGADILILDEPTAVLTPQETEKLFSVMRAMKADGKSIIIITHKLNEVDGDLRPRRRPQKGRVYRLRRHGGHRPRFPHRDDGGREDHAQHLPSRSACRPAPPRDQGSHRQQRRRKPRHRESELLHPRRRNFGRCGHRGLRTKGAVRGDRRAEKDRIGRHLS